MQISKYGILLTSLTSFDIELVRAWRNSEHVRPYMQYQKMIHSNEQLRWFEGLNEHNNLYFIISKTETKFGLIHLKEINRTEGIAEAGIFIGETQYLNTMYPLLATICLMEFAFDVLKLKQLKAKIGINNQRVIKFNESLGYKASGQKSGDDFMYFLTNKQQFNQSIGVIKNLLEKLDKVMHLQFSKEEVKKFELDQNSFLHECTVQII